MEVHHKSRAAPDLIPLRRVRVSPYPNPNNPFLPSHYLQPSTIMKIRALDHGDLPKVAEIILAAMNNDRLWTAFVPRKSAHDTAFTQEMIDLLKARADPAKKDWDVQVVDIGRDNAPEVVAVAVWDVSSTREGSGSKG